MHIHFTHAETSHGPTSHASTPMLQHPKLQLPKLHLLAFIHIHCTSLNSATLFTYFPLPTANCWLPTPLYSETTTHPQTLLKLSNPQPFSHHYSIANLYNNSMPIQFYPTPYLVRNYYSLCWIHTGICVMRSQLGKLVKVNIYCYYTRTTSTRVSVMQL